MKNMFLLLKVLFIAIAIAASVCAAPFVVLAIGAIIAIESIDSYSLLSSFAKYKSVLNKVPDTETSDREIMESED